MTTEHDDNRPFPYSQRLGGEQPLTFAKAIWAWRECEELTQSEVARQLGISRQMLNMYESGRKRPSIKLAYAIAQALGMDAETTVLLLINEQLRESEIPVRVALAS